MEPDQGDRAAVEVAAWAASGAMALTGRLGEAPLGPPAGFIPKLRAVSALIEERSAGLGRRVLVDPTVLLTERAALSGLVRGGVVSCGGATQLLETRDGWFTVSLARDEDIELVPAWLQADGPMDDVWDAIARIAAATSVDELVDRGVLVGLPVAALANAHATPSVTVASIAPLPVRVVRKAVQPPAATLTDLVVLDLSALWAGPLCGSLLAAAGAEVIKVESIARLDGARNGPADFFSLLNAGKRSVALDFNSIEGRRALRELVDRADIVVEASRPRALEQLGLSAEELLELRGRGPTVWVSITGHGRSGAGRDRVAFGDDAAVAGGLVCWDNLGPCFCADAVADPLAGIVAAAAVLDALRAGGRWLLDVAMAQVAAYFAGPTLSVPAAAAHAVAAPRARSAIGRGPELGADTETVLARLRER